MGAERQQTPVGVRIAALASRQHGVVGLRQLEAFGLSASAVHRRGGEGRLHRVHRGVYAVGHEVLGLDGKRMAAVLACGPGALLSHRAAADLHGLRPDSTPRFDVMSPKRTGQRKRGIRVHSAATLAARDFTSVRRIPVTAVPRTLLDLAELVNQRQVERAIARAEELRVFDLAAIHELLERSRGRRGAPRLKRALREEPVLTANEFEELMFALCRAARVPRPESNYPIGEYKADFAWPAHMLIAETDGRGTHLTIEAFEHDRLRDRELLKQGWRVVRFTYRQLHDDPDEVAATLRTLLL